MAGWGLTLFISQAISIGASPFSGLHRWDLVFLFLVLSLALVLSAMARDDLPEQQLNR